jgi:hypothetical protein
LPHHVAYWGRLLPGCKKWSRLLSYPPQHGLERARRYVACFGDGFTRESPGVEQQKPEMPVDEGLAGPYCVYVNAEQERQAKG